MSVTRRSLLHQAAALSAAALTRQSLALPAVPPSTTAARLTLHPNRIVATVPPSFVGLGYEISSVTRPGVFEPRGQYVNLVRTLGPRGVIRIGGNTADFASFSPNGTSVSSPKGTVVTQADLHRLRQFLDATGWQLIWSVNLGSGASQPQIDRAVEEAVAISTTMGEHLLALEIGNEPDLFFVEHRPKPYTYQQFRSEFAPFRDAILQRLPDLPLAGPDAAVANDWVRRFATDEPRNLKLLTQHYYREGQNPTSTMDKLLRADPRLPAALAELRSVSTATGLPYRICEVNSFSGGGRPGVSDTFASALWVLDYMLLLAQNGCSGVNMETGVNQLDFVSSYSPIVDHPDATAEERPEYYGMLAFAEATGTAAVAGEDPTAAKTTANSFGMSSAQLIAADFTAGAVNATAYAIKRSPARITVVLINKDPLADLTVRVQSSAAAPTRAGVTRLSAPSLDATSGVKLGGRTLDTQGNWRPEAAQPLQLNAGITEVSLPAATAALIHLDV